MPATDDVDEPQPDPQPEAPDTTKPMAIVATLLLAGWIVLYVGIIVWEKCK